MATANIAKNDSANQEHRCRWGECSAALTDEESLFNHVNEDHIGRIARGNLCLECRWEGCTATKAKRDHLISHIKSHLDYKPYGCEQCDARFKHMSDLKRHENVHRPKIQSPPTTTYDQIQMTPYTSPTMHTTMTLPPSPLSTPSLHAQQFPASLAGHPGNFGEPVSTAVPLSDAAVMLAASIADRCIVGSHPADTPPLFPTSVNDALYPVLPELDATGHLPPASALSVYSRFLQLSADGSYQFAELSPGTRNEGEASGNCCANAAMMMMMTSVATAAAEAAANATAAVLRERFSCPSSRPDSDRVMPRRHSAPPMPSRTRAAMSCGDGGGGCGGSCECGVHTLPVTPAAISREQTAGLDECSSQHGGDAMTMHAASAKSAPPRRQLTRGVARMIPYACERFHRFRPSSRFERSADVGQIFRP